MNTRQRTSRTVVVTGAAGALGRAVAEAFADDETSLVLVDMDPGALRAAHGDRARSRLVAVDLTDAAATAAALGEVFPGEDAPHVVCNVAGGFAMGPAADASSFEMVQRMHRVNVDTMLNTCAALAPRMAAAGRGAIVNVSAASALAGKPGMGAYCAAKSAVSRLTESLSAELRPRGVQVNAVAPSILDTPANRADMPGADFSLWVSPAQLAAVMRFLASPAAAVVHGVTLPVVGGV